MRVNFPLLLPLLLHLGATALGVLILGFIPHQNKSYPSQTQLTDFDIATFTHHVTTTVAGITATSHNTEAWWYYDRTCSSPPIGTLSCTKYWNVTDPEEGSGGIVGSVNDLLSSSFDERRGDMEARVLKRSVGWLVPAGLGLHGLLSIVLLALTFGIFRRLFWPLFAIFLILVFLVLAATIVIFVAGALYSIKTVQNSDDYSVTFGIGFWMIVAMEGATILSALITPFLRHTYIHYGGGSTDRLHTGDHGYSQF